MLEILRCNICGKILMVVHNGAGTTVCCGQPMEILTEKSEDQGKEKHVPVVEKTAGGIRVRVGAVPHPMEQDHYIAWIEVISGDLLFVKGLHPGEAPEAVFPTTDPDVKARIYCNKHGLWSNKPKKH